MTNTSELTPMLEGLARLLATSSRDWGQYAPDAWLYAVICGWDCEETEHDETCTHGAMEEMAERHGWDEATVAKARRYRAAVRAVVEPPADQTTPSHRAGLRDHIAGALIAWTYRGKDPDPETGILETVRANAYSRADAVLAVLYREWPWLRAEAEDAKPADRAAVLRDAADAIDNSERLRDFTDDHMSDINEAANELRRMADETATETPEPHRGDAFEQWLKARRDEWAPEGCQPWQILDQTLEEYRLHADTGTPLGEHLCEGRVVGDCECLEQPATTARQDGSQP